MKYIFDPLAKIILELRKPSDMDSVRQKQMLLNPAGSGSQLTDEYYIKKISMVLTFICVGLILALLIWLSDLNKAVFIDGNVLERNESGGGEKTVNLDVYTDDELYEKNRVITVSERKYSEEETRQFLEEAEDMLASAILGENKDPDHIDRDLNLITTFEDSPFSVEWLISDYNVLDGSGSIREDFDNENGELVCLTATLSYEDIKREYVFYVNVFPAYREADEKLSKDIDRKIKQYDQMTVSYNRQLLPDEADGRKLSYKKSSPKTALYILVITLLAATAVYFGKDSELDKAVKAREREMLISYPEIVSKLTLLLGAGLTIRAAFEKTVSDRKKSSKGKVPYAYEEMMITVNRMKSGTSEYEAYLAFGKRCAVKRYVKLGAL